MDRYLRGGRSPAEYRAYQRRRVVAQYRREQLQQARIDEARRLEEVAQFHRDMARATAIYYAMRFTNNPGRILGYKRRRDE